MTDTTVPRFESERDVDQLVRDPPRRRRTPPRVYRRCKAACDDVLAF